ncbi:hypothetical protein B0H19DRAFT_1182481 [Mycena capillaripes]|nr:hypothetical protein B0H19DRAFT_1182481 [Mycena capillaripes]
MKRVAEELERDLKRQKRATAGVDSTAIFKDEMQEKNGTDLLSWTPGDSGYLSGKVVMKWPPLPQKYRIKLEIFSLAVGAKQFEVTFLGRCADEFRRKGLQFEMKQELRLSLKGAVIETKPAQGITLPVALKYCDGIALELQPINNTPGCTVDTWFRPPSVEEPSEPATADDDWFATPRDPRPPRLAIALSELMDVDEEVSPVAVPPPPPEKPVSTMSIASKKSAEQNTPDHANPLNDVANSSRPAPPSRAPGKNTLTSFPSSSRPLRMIRPVAPSLEFSVPKEKQPTHQHPRTEPAPPSAPHQATARLPTTNGNHASSSNSRNGPPEAPVAAAARSVSADTEKPILTKKQRRNKLRKEKRKLRAGPQLPDAPPVRAATTPGVEPASIDAPVRRESSAPAAPVGSNVLPVAAHTHQPQPAPSFPQLLPNIRQPQPSSSEPNLPPAEARPRPQVPYGFTLLSELKPGGKIYSAIGVIAHIKEASKTRTNEWSRSLRIVDPSNCEESLYVTRPGTEGLLINCFTKKYKEWLPTSREGSVIILRGIKATTNSGVTVANGYHDKMQWAVYDPTTRQINHGDLGSAPQCERLDGGYGMLVRSPDWPRIAGHGGSWLFTPFYPGEDSDLPYCVALDDWWRGVSEKRLAAMGNVHQVGGDSASISWGGASRRKHQLVSETKLEQYFDCTVRVIHGHSNRPTYRLYVTDGTRLDGGYPCHVDSCPISLAEYLLPIEMWDEAGLIGPKMLTGEYYMLNNVRIKQNRYGYAEGKLVENKIQKLELDDAKDYPHFKALLDRLKPHDRKDVDQDPDLKLIGQVGERDYFSCVVELLHIDESQRAIYVTDWTSHSKNPAIKGAWADGLDGYVLKIMFHDEKLDRMQHLVIGHYYTILHLRLQSNSTAREFRGTLGGSHRLIIPVNPKSSSVIGEWKDDLVQRKNKVKFQARSQSDSRTERRPETTPQPVQPFPPRQNHRNCFSLKVVLATTDCPRTFNVRARVVDFFPFKLEDAFVRTCTRCNSITPKNRLACYGCDDVEHKYVQIVSRLRLAVADAEDEIQLSVSGNIPLLHGIESVILHENPDAARQFSKRLKPLLNNLEAVHDSFLEKESIEPSAPEMTLIIDSWEGADKKIIYGLRDYVSV